MQVNHTLVQKILFVGPLGKGSTTLQRLRCFQELGHHVVDVDTQFPPLQWPVSMLYRLLCRVGYYLDPSRANKRIIYQINRNKFDVVWIEKGLSIKPRTLQEIKLLLPAARLISYCIDDMMLPANQSLNYLSSISIYDLHITNKTYNVAELSALGARNVQFFANAYDKNAYHPPMLSEQEKELWGAEVAFVGGYEKQRHNMMLALANMGIVITIWGPGWEPYIDKHSNLIVKPGWVQAENAAKIFHATKINLHFLRKVARDLQTTRSVEIPACNAFMLAERTQEHLDLFNEGTEAEYFDDLDELQEKIHYYLLNDAQRIKIAAAGYQRSIISRYSYHDRLDEILKSITGVRLWYKHLEE